MAGGSIAGSAEKFLSPCGLTRKLRLGFLAGPPPSVLWWPWVGPAYNGKTYALVYICKDFKDLDESLL